MGEYTKPLPSQERKHRERIIELSSSNDDEDLIYDLCQLMKSTIYLLNIKQQFMNDGTKLVYIFHSQLVYGKLLIE